jgi:predicted enzyme related to lactoylglutathione lyase
MAEGQAQHNLRVDYVEFPATDIAATKTFYNDVFDWIFEDYGPEYTAFNDGRLSGGFFQSPNPPGHGALVVIYASDLEAVQEKVLAAGGRIVKETFSFPGGRRFHFADPNGNELAVWSDHETKK